MSIMSNNQNAIVKLMIKRKFWKKKPELFIKDVLGYDIPKHQVRMLYAILKHKKVSIRSCNAAGKSFIVSAIIIWFFYCFMDANVENNVVVLFTAPTFDQVKNNIHSNLKQFINKADKNLEKILGQKVQLIGKISNAKNECVISIDERPRDYIQGLTSNKGANETAGKHGESVLVVYDEAQGINDISYSDYKGIVNSGTTVKEVMIGNTTLPNGNTGQFYESFVKDNGFHRMKISAFDTDAFIELGLTLDNYLKDEDDSLYWRNIIDRYCIKNIHKLKTPSNFKPLELHFDTYQDYVNNLDKIFPYKNAVKNDLIEAWEKSIKIILPFCRHIVNPQEVYDKLCQCGYNVEHYEFKTRILAEFPDSIDSALFPSRAIERSFDLWKDLNSYIPGKTFMGIDIGGGIGSDKSSICVVRGNKEIYRERFDLKAPELIKKIKELHRIYFPELIKMETDGVGLPLFQMLQDEGLPVIGVQSGGGAGYSNSTTDEEREYTEYAKSNFGCKRDEIHWNFKELLNPIDPNKTPFLMKPDNEIKAMLQVYTYTRKGANKIHVIPKTELRKMFGRSPDDIDSLLIALAPFPEDAYLDMVDYTFISGT